jgi:hypothetical protein
MCVATDTLPPRSIESSEALAGVNDDILGTHSRGQFDTDRLLAIAKELRDTYGWSIIAVEVNKKSVGAWKEFQRRRPNDEELAAMFRMPGCTGLAVIAGPVSNDLVVRDFDIPDSYHRWARDNAELAKGLPTVQTARGYHVLFRCPGFVRLSKQGDGEIRGKGYSLLPPSWHDRGVNYRWLVPPMGEIPPVEDPVAVGLAKPNTGHIQAQCNLVTEYVYVQEDKELRSTPVYVQGDGVPEANWPIGVIEAIAETLPSGPGRRNQRLFDLARHLKYLCGGAPNAMIRAIVKKWHRMALPFITTKEFDISWAEFITAWDAVRSPPILMTTILNLAEQMETPAVVAELEYGERVQKLVKICIAAQACYGDRPFFLSAREAAKHTSMSRSTAHNILKMLVVDGILKCIDRGTSGKNGRAAKWKCLV